MGHKRNVVHRDIKPENFKFRTPRCEPQELVLLDFGLAMQLDDERPDKTRCNVEYVGTADYASPEMVPRQATCSLTGATLKASDMWSAACVTFALIIGATPFGSKSGNPLQTLQAIYSSPLRFPSRNRYLSPQFKDFCTRLLKKKPADRLSMSQAL